MLIDEEEKKEVEEESVEETEESTDMVTTDEIEEIDISDEELETSADSIKISNDTIATYASIAISNVQGVYAMAGGIFSKSSTKGIKVDVGEKNTKIDINIIVNYGARIPDVAFEIQNSVKKIVEDMTGLKVLEVNVNVSGVHASYDKNSKPELDEAKEAEENEEENTNEE